MCRRQLSEALCQKANAAWRVFLQYTRLSEGRGKKTGLLLQCPFVSFQEKYAASVFGAQR